MAVLSAEELRMALADTPEYNLPLNNVYLDTAELQTAIDLALDDYNNTPPELAYPNTLLDFPSKKILLMGAMVEAYRLTAHKELRGRMDYSDGGVQNTLYTKSPEFINLQDRSEQVYERMKTRFKRQQNMKNCYGGIS